MKPSSAFDFSGEWRLGAAVPHALWWRNRLWSIVGLSALLPLVMAFAAFVGSEDVPFVTVWKILLSQLPGVDFLDDSAQMHRLSDAIVETRLPRIVLGGLVGSALAVAGATYQGLFRNPLADPYFIGVAPGALLGAVIGFWLSPGTSGSSGFEFIPLFAFAGGTGAVVVVYSIARTGRSLPVTTLILAGVALGACLSSITHYLMYKSDDERLHAIISWMFGHIDDEWIQVLIVLPFVVIGTGIIWMYARPLNVMQLDEDQAEQLGIPVERVKIVLLACSTLITAAAVAFCGTIAFVGIIIPHTVRLIWGPDHRFLLPLSTLVGAIFMILADVLVRAVSGPEALPIGVVTASVGGPFFLYLLRTRRRGTFF